MSSVTSLYLFNSFLVGIILWRILKENCLSFRFKTLNMQHDESILKMFSLFLWPPGQQITWPCDWVGMGYPLHTPPLKRNVLLDIGIVTKSALHCNNLQHPSNKNYFGGWSDLYSWILLTYLRTDNDFIPTAVFLSTVLKVFNNLPPKKSFCFLHNKQNMVLMC